MSATYEHLVAVAYEALRARVIKNLQGEMRDLERIIDNADESTKSFWSRVRAKGIPDRPAERDAYQMLRDQILDLTKDSE